MNDKPTKPKDKRLILLGIVFLCLGVVFIRRSSLGGIFFLFGAALIVIGLIKKNRG